MALKLLVWAVNAAAVVCWLVEFGVDGITTDHPGWLREQVAGAAETIFTP